MIKSEVSIRVNIRGSYGTTESNSDPFSCKVDNDTINKTTLAGTELIILYK